MDSPNSLVGNILLKIIVFIITFFGFGERHRTPPDYNEYLSTWLEYNGLGFTLDYEYNGGIELMIVSTTGT